MTTLKLKRETTISVVEMYLERLTASPCNRIELPSNYKIKNAILGGESALIQFLLTWARQNPCGEVAISVETGNLEEEEYKINHLAKRAYSFVAMLAAQNVLATDSATSVRHKTNNACSLQVDKMGEGIGNTTYGHRVFLACVDHSSKGNLPTFYFSDGTLRNRSEFTSLAKELLTSFFYEKISRNIPHSTQKGIGLILYELIKNTHDWGRTSLENVPLRPSIRGLLCTGFANKPGKELRSAGNNQPLQSYVQSLEQKSRDDNVRFIELSIFDGGLGLASSWLGQHLGDDFPLSDELKACYDCLAKHSTTSGSSSRGLGLYEVMKTLNELQAYVRIRTGRLALCRDFIQSPLQEEDISAPKLFDWESYEETPTQMVKVEGTLFTIIIPLVEGRN